MAKNLRINGVTYNDVEEVKIPLAEDTNEMAVFNDTFVSNGATATDIKKDKTAWVDGALVKGTKTDPVLSLTDGVLNIS